jgi:hypothetical protein
MASLIFSDEERAIEFRPQFATSFDIKQKRLPGSFGHRNSCTVVVLVRASRISLAGIHPSLVAELEPPAHAPLLA